MEFYVLSLCAQGIAAESPQSRFFGTRTCSE